MSMISTRADNVSKKDVTFGSQNTAMVLLQLKKTVWRFYGWGTRQT
jgi:hypothetical protein